MKHKKFIRGPLFLLKMVLILAVTSVIVMLLWNALIPAIFSGPVITYWQAAGLLLLPRSCSALWGADAARGTAITPMKCGGRS